MDFKVKSPGKVGRVWALANATEYSSWKHPARLWPPERFRLPAAAAAGTPMKWTAADSCTDYGPCQQNT